MYKIRIVLNEEEIVEDNEYNYESMCETLDKFFARGPFYKDDGCNN